jgi:hypothetical protein
MAFVAEKKKNEDGNEGDEIISECLFSPFLRIRLGANTVQRIIRKDIVLNDQSSRKDSGK